VSISWSVKQWDCGLNGKGLILDREKRFLFSPQHPDWIFLSDGYWGTLLCQGVKWPVREADYRAPSIAKVENGEAIHLHSAIYFYGVVN
jgi:hypothetical protein